LAKKAYAGLPKRVFLGIIGIKYHDIQNAAILKLCNI